MTAVEFNRAYCLSLERRAQALLRATGRTFRVECARYQNAPLDRADVFTWWFGGGGLDSAALLHLRRVHDAGGLRPNASAIVLFEKGTKDDDDSRRAIERFATWREEVPFDETQQCMTKYSRKPWLCSRSNASYYMLNFPVAAVPLTVRADDPKASLSLSKFAKQEAAVG